MTTNEYRKKGGLLHRDTYAVAIIFGARDESEFGRELRHAKAALLDWFERRGKSGDTVQLLVSSREIHTTAERVIRDLVEHEVDLADELQRRSIQVSFLGLAGRPVKEMSWANGRWN